MLIPFGTLAASGGVAGDFELINTQILASATPSITFDVSSFVSTYKHLQIRMVTRTTLADAEDSVIVRLNGDSATNYSYHFIFANGASVISAAQVSQTLMYPFAAVGNTQTANGFGAHIIDFLDSSSISKNKTIRSLTGYATGTNRIALASGLWRNTSAITSISINPGSSNWNTGSRFSIYGIKG
jgi:hypothetical protein